MKPNIMLVGCGPHAKRVYIPMLKDTANEYATKLKVVIELEEKIDGVIEFVGGFFKDAEIVTIKQFKPKYNISLPADIEKLLNDLVEKHDINAIIISTDPLHHLQYALWAQKKGLHILMDKPISTYNNIANSLKQSKQLLRDYKLLMSNYKSDKAFIINAQRRFLPQFQIIQDKVNEVARLYGMPITAMQSTHSDGQWRLPNEILTLKYHPLIGWGKVSHSGYHFIDMASKIGRDSYIKSLIVCQFFRSLYDHLVFCYNNHKVI